MYVANIRHAPKTLKSTLDENIKFLFDHLRNVGIAATVFFAGLYILRHFFITDHVPTFSPSSFSASRIQSDGPYVAYLIMTAGILLLLVLLGHFFITAYAVLK